VHVIDERLIIRCVKAIDIENGEADRNDRGGKNGWEGRLSVGGGDSAGLRADGSDDVSNSLTGGRAIVGLEMIHFGGSLGIERCEQNHARLKSRRLQSSLELRTRCAEQDRSISACLSFTVASRFRPRRGFGGPPQL